MLADALAAMFEALRGIDSKRWYGITEAVHLLLILVLNSAKIGVAVNFPRD
jgi:hypothetical protein